MDTNKIDFSDDENENEDEIINELPEEEEMDDEMRAYIFSLTANKKFDEEFFTERKTISKKKRVRKKKEKQDNKMFFQIDEPNYDIVKEEKTWKSKRVAEKKVDMVEYKFKPRKAPYEYREGVDKNVEEKPVLSIDDFPAL